MGAGSVCMVSGIFSGDGRDIDLGRYIMRGALFWFLLT